MNLLVGFFLIIFIKCFQYVTKRILKICYFLSMVVILPRRQLFRVIELSRVGGSISNLGFQRVSKVQQQLPCTGPRLQRSFSSQVYMSSNQRINKDYHFFLFGLKSFMKEHFFCLCALTRYSWNTTVNQACRPWVCRVCHGTTRFWQIS